MAVANFIVAFWGEEWTSFQVGGLVGLITWLSTWGSACYDDLRGIILARALRRRASDRRRG